MRWTHLRRYWLYPAAGLILCGAWAAPPANAGTADRVLIFSGPSNGQMSRLALTITATDDSGFAAVAIIRGARGPHPQLDRAGFFEFGSRMFPHLWANGSDQSEDVCGASLIACQPVGDESLLLRLPLRPGESLVVAAHAKISGLQLPRGWTLTDGHGFQRVTATTIGASDSAAAAYAGRWSVEDFRGAQLRGGPSRSFAIASLPCDQAGEGAGTLRGGSSPMTLSCTTTAALASSISTRKVNWQFTADATGISQVDTRLVVVDL